MFEMLPEKPIWRISAFAAMLKTCPLWMTGLVHLHFSIIFWSTIPHPDSALQSIPCNQWGAALWHYHHIGHRTFHFLTLAALLTVYVWVTTRFTKASSRKLALSGMYQTRNANTSWLRKWISVLAVSISKGSWSSWLTFHQTSKNPSHGCGSIMVFIK